MTIEWNDVLSRIETLERQTDQLRKQLTQITSELDYTWEVYRQTQAELTNLKEDAATLRAISPYIKKRIPVA
jgi:chromosome segregation ATPase